MFQIEPKICPVCLNSSENKKFIQDYEFNEERFSLFECPLCNVQFWMPFRNPGENWYKKEYSSLSYESASDGLRDSQKKFLKRKHGSIFDFGSGSGNFLFCAKKEGMTGVGFEFNEVARAISIDRGIKLVYSQADLEFIKGKFQDYFDFFTAFEVIEHLDSPSEVISLADIVLKKNGVLVLSVPLRSRLLIGYDVFDYPPNHLSRWDAHSVVNFLERSGFYVEKIAFVDDFDLTLDSFFHFLSRNKKPKENSKEGFSSNLKKKNIFHRYSKLFVVYFLGLVSKTKTFLNIGNSIYIEAKKNDFNNNSIIQ